MTRPIDYWAIRQGIAMAIRNAPGQSELLVLHELGRLPAPEECPCVLIYMIGRETPAELQRISAGRELAFRLRFSVWVLHYSLSSLEDAVRKRDEMLGATEMALMADRTLGGLLPRRAVYFEGGEVTWNRETVSQAFVSAIETRLVYEVSAEL